MVDKDEILRLLKKHFETTGDVTVDDKGLVSCTGSVDLRRSLLVTRLPVSFKKIDKHFWCYKNQLESLDGAPKSVHGAFICHTNQLKSLEGAPESVRGSLRCDNNPLESLDGLPRTIGVTLTLTYHKHLPLLRCLLPLTSVLFYEKNYYQTGDAEKVQEILERYYGQGKKALFDCQKDLEDAGFEGNARW